MGHHLSPLQLLLSILLTPCLSYRVSSTTQCWWIASALLCLKVGSPVILLRNLDPGEGLCNGTRMVVLNVRRKVLQCRIISKDRRFKDKVVLIPRIRLSPNAETLLVPLKRLQFPVRLAFSRCISPLNISVLLPEQSQESRRTLNIVYKEVFNSIRL